MPVDTRLNVSSIRVRILASTRETGREMRDDERGQKRKEEERVFRVFQVSSK